ncbi:serine-rich protein [Aspergillus niger]|uniref:uncharacterized protein n=1 Tax=Aspergillus lacticoffeatus (strain CBS 101883) TaxID=1450533 RepID=UPI000D7EC8DF|nr:uncharacterized protein BO96DRAFT_432671 [Aspergillus niger CBS 101883]PYH58006.1 hypothetical protein BO96DRAFT_432671 [Aspergillus niger CBS 101883]GJP94893.1 serine-rich protein [Aspergillus niger]
MVFLRLRVKVYPREQVAPTPSFSFRSILGDRDRDRDDASRGTNGSSGGKPVAFLLVLEKPEDITLGGLAGLIQDKWRKLRPNAEPLDIKKLLDDDHESDDLDADMTVAEVFVDNGRARQDLSDQRGTVRVIQKPGQYAPVRFPSVTQDWDAAAQNFERQIQVKKEAVKKAMDQIPTIHEEENNEYSNAGSVSARSSAWSPYENRRSEIPVSSVEKDEVPGSPAPWDKKPVLHEEDSQNQIGSSIAATPLHKRMQSQELGDSPSHTPTPEERTASRHSSSQGSARQPVKEATESKANGSHEMESIDGSLSPLSTRKPPQRRQVPEPQPPAPVVDVDSESESESEDESEDETGDENDENVAPPSAQKNKLQNGDVEMHDTVESTEEQPQSSNSNSRKRKLSQDSFEPSKEPRLSEPGSTHATPKGIKDSMVTVEVSPYTPSKRARAPSFGFSPRRSFLMRAPSAPPKHGLGLGITRSPPNNRLTRYLTQDSAIPPPNFLAPNGTPEIPSSAPTIRRGSVSLAPYSTPSKAQAPLDKVKNLHSALRKSSPAERPSERRSVSFAESDEVVFAGSQPVPKSNPQSTSKSRAKSSDPDRRTSDPSSMVFPASVPKERLDQLMEEANRKIEQDKQYEEKLQAKLQTAREQKAGAQYIRKLQELTDAWMALKKAEKHQKTKTVAQRKFDTLQKEVDRLEATQKPKPASATPQKKQQSTTPRTQPTDAAKLPTPHDAKSASGSKSPASESHTQPQKTSPMQMRTRSASKLDASPKIVPSEPQSSFASDNLDLPPMDRTVHRAGSSKPSGTPVRASTVKSPEKAPKPSPQAPIELSSDSEESEESDSESESESESEEEEEKKPAIRQTASSPVKANTATPSQVPASQPAPSQTWARPSSATRTTRTTLKSLIQNQKKELEAKTQPKRAANSQPQKRSVYSPPSDDSESESESESSSSDSDSD